MARKRMIDPDFWIDSDIAELPFAGRLLYIGLWNFADDRGVLPYQPKQIRAQIFPYDAGIEVEALLEQLMKLGKLTVFEVDGSQFLYVKNFLRHQTIKRPTYKYPAPPELSTCPDNPPTCSAQIPNNVRTCAEHVLLNRKEEKGKEGEENIPDTGIVYAPAHEEAPAPPQSKDDIHYGYRATSGSRKSAEEFIRHVEALFGVYPFSNRQIGDKTADRTKEELAAILRILSTDEALGIVRERYDARLQETKGADRPTNLVWYMPALKEAFFAKDRALEVAERRRDEERKRKRRDPADEPISIGKMLEKELSPEERAAKFREIKERIAKAGRV